jgi:glycosyltransferase involved in cell wall biosynthesis
MVEADLHGQRGPMGRGPSAVLQLAYAGVPGRKDLIGNAIRSLSLLGGAAQQVRLMLIGPTAAEARCLLGADGALLDKHASRVTCRGRCSHNEALSLVAAADFTVLLRPDVRFTRAGFPSKFVESLSLGVPLIANLTGDISSHLTDGREGIVLEAATPEACRDGIRRILAMPRWHWQEMRERARSRAVTSFAYERFAGDLCRFVEKTRIVP